MSSNRVEDVISSIRAQTDIPDAPKREIIEQLESIPRPLDTDPWIYRIVVLFLGLTVLVTVLGGIALTWVGGTSQNFQIPQGVVAIGSAAVGALAGLLAPSPRQA